MPSTPPSPVPRALVEWLKLSRDVGEAIMSGAIQDADTAQKWCDAHWVHPQDFREAVNWWTLALDIDLRTMRRAMAEKIATRPPFK